MRSDATMMATTASSCTTSTATATATESFLPAHRVSNDSDDGLGSASSSPQPVGPPDADPDDDNDKIMRTTMPGSEVQQQAKTDIGALVAKSKRAASSLWTLLHAKNCRLGVNRCAHSGCAEAKMIFLHLKTCSAGPLDTCPSNHKGCQDARKLLAHYRRCRDIRTRQAQNPSKSQQQHVCLVCSLVARHAKFSLERGGLSSNHRSNGSSKPNGGLSNGHYNIPSLNLTCESISEDETPEQFSLSHSFEENKGYLSSHSRYQQSLSRPRFAFSRTNQGSNRSPPSNGLSALLAASSSTVLEDDCSSASYANGGQPYQRPRAGSMPIHQPDRNESVNGVQDQQHGDKSLSYLLAAVDSFTAEHEASSTGHQESDQHHSLGAAVTSNPAGPPTLGRKRSETWSVGSAPSASGVTSASDPLECVLGGRIHHRHP